MVESVDLSVVIPAYNEEGNVVPLFNKLKAVLDKTKKSYEIIFVDDGSSDKTVDNLKRLSEKYKDVRVIALQGNFEKAAALSAGFSKAKGDTIITMDADLQDNPEEIPRFLEKLSKGYDLVVGWRHKRIDPLTKKIASKIFNFFVRKMTCIKLHDSDCNFRAMKKQVITKIPLYSGLYRYIPSLANSRGYKISEVKVKHNARKSGRSKYGFSRLYKGFFDLLTIKFLLSYNKRPLHLFGGIGLISLFFGFIAGLQLLYLKYYEGILIGSRPMLFLSLLLIIMGVQFISIGFIGEMITNSNQRKEDLYIIKREL